MNWERRIGEAEDAEGFTWTDELDALGWDSCAVGELAWKLYEGQPPKDHVLKRLGNEFSSDVSENDYACALRTFRKIEDRVEVLVASNV